MTWKQLLDGQRIAREAPRKEELKQLRAVAERNLADAAIEGLSTDGRFGHAYEAARALATMVVRASGYRVRAVGGAHYTTFLALEAADSKQFAKFSAYFETCRGKRNDLSYDAADVVTEHELSELLVEVPAFQKLVEQWLRERYPDLVG
jgi:hypothetical protein